MTTTPTPTTTPRNKTPRNKTEELFDVASMAEHLERSLHVLAMFAIMEDQHPRIAALRAGIEALRAEAQLIERENFKAWHEAREAQDAASRVMPSARKH